MACSPCRITPLALTVAAATLVLLVFAPAAHAGGQAAAAAMPADDMDYGDEDTLAMMYPVFSLDDPSTHEQENGSLLHQATPVISMSDLSLGLEAAGGPTSSSGSSVSSSSSSIGSVYYDSYFGSLTDSDAALRIAEATNQYEGEVVLMEQQMEQQMEYQLGGETTWERGSGLPSSSGSDSSNPSQLNPLPERGSSPQHSTEDAGGSSAGAYSDESGDLLAAATNSYEGEVAVTLETLEAWQQEGIMSHEDGFVQQQEQQLLQQQPHHSVASSEAGVISPGSEHASAATPDLLAGNHSKAVGRLLLQGSDNVGEDEYAGAYYDAEAALAQQPGQGAAAAGGAVAAAVIIQTPLPEGPGTAAVSGLSTASAASALESESNAPNGHTRVWGSLLSHLPGWDAGKHGRPLWGITYSWRRAEECDGGRQVCRCPEPEQLRDDMALLQGYATRVRTFSVECPDLMRGLLRASQEPSSSSAPAQPWLLLGIWIGRDAAANSAQLQLLSSLLHEQPGARLMGIAVGSEAVSRGDVSAATLVQLVAQVRDVLRAAAATTASGGALRAVPVLTVEPPEAFTDQLLAAVDVAGIVLQPFFGAQLDTSRDGWAQRACEAELQRVAALRARAAGKGVVVAEVGWPTRSGELDASRSSLRHAAEFVRAWIKAADAVDLLYFYHELADAAWKGELRRGAAAAVRAARRAALPRAAGPPGVLEVGVMGDEYFGLVSSDRKVEKGVVAASLGTA